MTRKLLSILIIIYSTIGIGIISGLNIANAATGENDLSGKGFMINVGDISPSDNKYVDGPKANISNILNRATQILLIIIPTLAVLFMVVGGIKMITAGGDTSKISGAKNMITYNIIAVVIALLSFSIIQLIVWLLGSTS